MSDNSKIEWCEATWNPLAGCSEVSPGCTNCYAATMAKRLGAMGQKKYMGTTGTLANGKVVWTGTIHTDVAALNIPLKRRKPTMYFVNSMSDLFHEDVPDSFISKVVDVMATAARHTFQVLTKRPERMAELLPKLANRHAAQDGSGWPLKNVWWGTSVEDQKRAVERIPHLLKCPAAVRFLSCEPLLGPVDLCRYVLYERTKENIYHGYVHPLNGWYSDREQGRGTGCSGPKVDWVIVGGESGHGARHCQLEWIESIRNQCKAADVACFIKQLGSRSMDRAYSYPLKDGKGGDPAEWPPDLRVRQFPSPLR